MQLLCGLLCAALIFAAAPRAAAEDDDEDAGPLEILADSDEDWDYADGTYTVFDDITVVGYVFDGTPLEFVLENNSEVFWEANYSCMHDFAVAFNVESITLVEVKGNGIFRVTNGGEIGLDWQGTALKTGAGIELIVEDGSEVSSWPDELTGPCIAIDAGGGLFVKESTIRAINKESEQIVGPATAIQVTGDLAIVESRIYMTGKGPCIAVKSAETVRIQETDITRDEYNSETIALYMNGPGAVVISDSLFRTGGGIWAPEASVTLCEEAKVSAFSLMRYVDGTLYGNGIVAAKVTLEGNSWVTALNGAAIMYRDQLSITDSAVFAFGAVGYDDTGVVAEPGIGGRGFVIPTELPEPGPDYDEFTMGPFDPYMIDHMLNVIYQYYAADIDFVPGVPYLDRGADHTGGLKEHSLAVAFDFDTWITAEDKSTNAGTQSFLCAAARGETGYQWTGKNRTLSILCQLGEDSFSVPFMLGGLPGKPMAGNPKDDPTAIPDEDEGGDPTDDPGDTNPPNDTTPVPITPRPPLVVESEPAPTPAAAPKERAKPRPLPPLPEPATAPTTVPATEPTAPTTEPTAPTTEPTTAPSTEPVAGPSTPTGGDSGSSSGTTSPGTTAPTSRPPAAGGQQQTTEPSAEPTEPTAEPSTEPTEPAPQGVTAQAPTTTVPAATEPIVTPTAPVNPQDIAPPPEEKTGLAAAVPAIIGGGAVVTAGAGAAWVFKGWRKP